MTPVLEIPAAVPGGVRRVRIRLAVAGVITVALIVGLLVQSIDGGLSPTRLTIIVAVTAAYLVWFVVSVRRTLASLRDLLARPPWIRLDLDGVALTPVGDAIPPLRMPWEDIVRVVVFHHDSGLLSMAFVPPGDPPPTLTAEQAAQRTWRVPEQRRGDSVTVLAWLAHHRPDLPVRETRES